MKDKNYIGSQQHWEDSINADYDVRDRKALEQLDDRIQPDDREPKWIFSGDHLPPIGSNVIISDDGINEIGTADYIENRTCMLAGYAGGSGYFGKGFATDGSTGCEKGLILDTPTYWRFY